MILEATNLTKTYKSGKAVDAISLKLKIGQIYGVLGRNGAGKTTLFKILCNLVTADHGSLKIHSTKLKPIGAIIENPGLYTYLNAYENLKVFAEIQNAPRDKTRLEQYLKTVGLPLDRKDAVRHFSMGMKQRLAIAIALLNDPEIVILDEPFSGLDPMGVSDLIQLIKSLAAKNKSVLISSHMLAELQNCCDYLYVIDRGKLVNQGETTRLFNHSISRYKIKGNGVEQVKNKLFKIIFAEKNSIDIECKATEISKILENLIQQGYQITACIPQVTLNELLSQQPNDV